MERRRGVDVERAEAVLQRLRRSQGLRLRLRRSHPRRRPSARRNAGVEGRPLRPGPTRAAAGPGRPPGALGGRRARAGAGNAGAVHGDRKSTRHHRQDLEPPGCRRRPAARQKRRGDGRLPATGGSAERKALHTRIRGVEWPLVIAALALARRPRCDARAITPIRQRPRTRRGVFARPCSTT